MDSIQKLIDRLMACKLDGETLALAYEVKRELEHANRLDSESPGTCPAEQAFKAKATELANQRDQVQRGLDAAVAQLKDLMMECQSLRGVGEVRERRLIRALEGLTKAENELADLRWLVYWARQGATAPVISSVNPPPHVGGHSATAQAEGGVK